MIDKIKEKVYEYINTNINNYYTEEDESRICHICENDDRHYI